jgi:hypothetical protein
VTAMMLPLRTAREMPTFGSKGDPVETCQSYAATEEGRSTPCFAGASTIRATPITTSTAEPISSPRAISLAKACPAISIAWTKLDHAVNAIRLPFADGFRAASSKIEKSLTTNSGKLNAVAQLSLPPPWVWPHNLQKVGGSVLSTRWRTGLSVRR